MATYYRPLSVTLGGTTITTVTSVTINENFTSGNFAGDNDGYAAGWIGAAVISGSIAIGDLGQAVSLVGTNGALVIVSKGTAGASNLTTTIQNMQIAGIGLTNPFDANSGSSLQLVRVGAATSGQPISQA